MREVPTLGEMFAKAERFLRSASLLKNDGDYESAVSRLYYAMFYIAQAALKPEGQEYSSHREVLGAFGRVYIRTEILDRKLHQSLNEAFQTRNLGDYLFESGIQREKAQELIENAEHFLNEIRAYLIRTLGENWHESEGAHPSRGRDEL